MELFVSLAIFFIAISIIADIINKQEKKREELEKKIDNMESRISNIEANNNNKKSDYEY